MVTSLLVVVVCLALIFDFINGFHDAANSIATIVSTKVLTPFQAVIWAAAFNFLAFFLIKEHKVANTVAKTVHEHFITMDVILAGLIAAIAWNLLTWWFGIPSSSSHTLIGGFAGAGMTNAIFMGVNPITAVDSASILRIAAYIFLAPLIGLVIAYVITIGRYDGILIKLVFKDKYDEDTIVSADRDKVCQVLINLIDNSFKYGKEGGSTSVSLFELHDQVLVEVTDDGSGINEKYLPRLFERFYRIDSHRSRQIGGSGLGLAIVKHIIEAHEQTISVRSTEGVGSTFSFTLQKVKQLPLPFPVLPVLKS